MVVVGTHTGKHREYRYMVVGTVCQVQKGHPYRELNPHRECRYIVVIVTHTENHAGKCRECRYMVQCMGSIPCTGDLCAQRVLSPTSCTYISWVSLCSSLHGSPPLPCTYIFCVSLHGFQFPTWFPAFTACPSSHLCVILHNLIFN